MELLRIDTLKRPIGLLYLLLDLRRYSFCEDAQARCENFGFKRLT